jgi:flagellin
MVMRINHNLAAFNTYRQMGINQGGQAKSLEKLSSGLRINKAGDDAAGLAISEKMRGQIRGLNQSARNAQDGISMIQTAEGGLNEVHDILQRMRELAVQASTSTLESEDRTALGDEMLELKNEIDRISDDTEFNGKKLLNGSLATAVASSSAILNGSITTSDTLIISKIDVSGGAMNTTYTLSKVDADTLRLASAEGTQDIDLTSAMTTGTVKTISFGELGVSVSIVANSTSAATLFAAVSGITNHLDGLVISTASGSSSAAFAIGANEGQTMSVAFSDMGSDQLGDASNINTLVSDDQCVATAGLAQTLITEIDGAIDDVSQQRGVFGAAQNRLEHTIKNLDTSAENLQASESRIRDVDMAKEMMEFTKNNILVQAAQSMLAQANQQPQGVLGLLR